MTSRSDWTLITVTYQSVDYLRRHWVDPDREVTWIAVDNGSTDGSTDFLQTHADRLIVLPDNPGFATANNAALAEVTTPYVAFVNPDVRVPAQGWQDRLARMVDATQGLVGPQLTNTDGTEQPNARGLPYLAAKVANRTGTGDDGLYTRTSLTEPTYCAWLMGAAVTGATEVVRRLGGWNSDYFLYYEDHDLGLRAWRAGVPVVVDPAVRWRHDWERATTRLDRRAWGWELRSMKTFYRAYPELLSRCLGQAREDQWLRARGFGDLCERLWAPVSPPTAGEAAVA